MHSRAWHDSVFVWHILDLAAILCSTSQEVVVVVVVVVGGGGRSLRGEFVLGSRPVLLLPPHLSVWLKVVAVVLRRRCIVPSEANECTCVD